jgi:hypothetical protein
VTFAVVHKPVYVSLDCANVTVMVTVMITVMVTVMVTVMIMVTATVTFEYVNVRVCQLPTHYHYAYHNTLIHSHARIHAYIHARIHTYIHAYIHAHLHAPVILMIHDLTSLWAKFHHTPLAHVYCKRGEPNSKCAYAFKTQGTALLTIQGV